MGVSCAGNWWKGSVILLEGCVVGFSVQATGESFCDPAWRGFLGRQLVKGFAIVLGLVSCGRICGKDFEGSSGVCLEGMFNGSSGGKGLRSILGYYQQGLLGAMRVGPGYGKRGGVFSGVLLGHGREGFLCQDRQEGFQG